MIGRVLNSFIEALNEGRRLPRFLIVMLDKEIIEDINVFDYGASSEIIDNVNWLVRQIDIAIQRRKTATLAVKPGALYSTDPKVIFTTMIKRPLHFPTKSRMEKVVSLRTKFNNAINDAAYDRQHSILSVDVCDSEAHFDLLGNLNHMGQFMFWKQVNFLLQEFDRKNVNLAPSRRKSVSHRNGSGDRSSAPRR